MDVVDAELVYEPTAPPRVRCSVCARTSSDRGMVGRTCMDGSPPCRGRWIGIPKQPGQEVAGRIVADARAVDRRADAELDTSSGLRRAVAPDERPLTAAARELVKGGRPESTRVRYRKAWDPYESWCEAIPLASLPSAESTMIEYLTEWKQLPVHVRCAGGRQQNGEECEGHRPSPRTMWIWYSAVRYYHRKGRPAYAWFGGEDLADAMKGYTLEMKARGYKPNKAPRAYPENVMAMVDAMDLTNPRHLMDRAVILTNWYTAARASDLATYRITDVTITPRDLIKLSLSKSKTNHGEDDELRVIHPNRADIRYDGVTAVDAWITWLRDTHQITNGGLFRRWTRPGAKSGQSVLCRGKYDALDYELSGTALSDIVKTWAVRVGLPDGEYFTCHSLRRGRASHLRELKVDMLAIARAHGWADNGSLKEYMTEADLESLESATAMGMLAGVL